MIKAALVSVLIVLLFSSGVSAQSSSDSTLRQQITAFRCDYTTVATGFGVVHDSTCPYFDPTIEEVTSYKGRLYATGIYDAVHTKDLRVQVGGAWYVLGLDKELTVNGNVWVLDLREAKNALPNGEYTIKTQAEGTDGIIRQAERAVRVDDSTQAKAEDYDKQPTWLGGHDRGVRQGWLVPVSVSLIVSGSALLLYVIKSSKREEDDSVV